MTEESIPIHKLANLVLVSSSVRIHVPAVDDKFVVDLKFVKEETREQDDVEDEGRNCNTGDDQHVCPFKANHFHAAKKPCFSVWLVIQTCKRRSYSSAHIWLHEKEDDDHRCEDEVFVLLVGPKECVNHNYKDDPELEHDWVESNGDDRLGEFICGVVRFSVLNEAEVIEVFAEVPEKPLLVVRNLSY